MLRALRPDAGCTDRDVRVRHDTATGTPYASMKGDVFSITLECRDQTSQCEHPIDGMLQENEIR